MCTYIYTYLFVLLTYLLKIPVVFGEPSVACLLSAKWERKSIKNDQKTQPFWEENYDLEVLSLQENWTGQGNNHTEASKKKITYVWGKVILWLILHGRVPVSVWAG